MTCAVKFFGKKQQQQKHIDMCCTVNYPSGHCTGCNGFLMCRRRPGIHFLFVSCSNFGILFLVMPSLSPTTFLRTSCGRLSNNNKKNKSKRIDRNKVNIYCSRIESDKPSARDPFIDTVYATLDVSSPY